jgi:signal transduction histidine kinase
MTRHEERVERPGPAGVAAAEVDGLRALADEQAAVLRAAELVARTAEPAEVLAVVTAEASRLLQGRPTTLIRFDGNRELVVVASHGGPAPVGRRIAFEPDTLPDRVLRRGVVVRVDDYTGERDAELARGFGLAAAVAAPVRVAGVVWGMLTATSPAEPLPPATEARLDAFARLVTAAVGGSQARTELMALADEQAALRRVAELVARGAAPDEVFVAVAVEASALLGDLAAVLLRYEDDGEEEVAVAVATCNSPAPLGLRVPSHVGTPTGQVLRTGRPVRGDTFGGTPLADIARELGVASGVAVPIIVEGSVRATLTTSSSGPPLPADVELRLAQFADLAAVAIANAEMNAKLIASRARVVATADETRRRLQRDVHDGAQQRLVHALIALKVARSVVEVGSAAAGLVEEALTQVERASSELRDIVRGILPTSLTHGGLRVGLESLVADLALPVAAHITTRRLPAALETTAYFVVAEALTNAVKHSRAREVRLDVELDGNTLVVEVRDDGVGGADPVRGTGLTGLVDRVDAAGGVLAIRSPAGEGTTLRAALPVG